jgi:hypothetical protein
METQAQVAGVIGFIQHRATFKKELVAGCRGQALANQRCWWQQFSRHCRWLFQEAGLNRANTFPGPLLIY